MDFFHRSIGRKEGKARSKEPFGWRTPGLACPGPVKNLESFRIILTPVQNDLPHAGIIPGIFLGLKWGLRASAQSGRDLLRFNKYESLFTVCKAVPPFEKGGQGVYLGRMTL